MMVEPTLIQQGPYTIRKIPARPFDFDVYPKTIALSNIIAWTLWASYLLVQAVIISKNSRSKGFASWICWLGLAGELCISCNDLVHALHLIIQLLRPAQVQLPRPYYRLMGEVVPTIDVFVPSCGEPVDVVINTASSAADQDYPEGRLRVMILDDGNNQELSEAVERLDHSKRFTAQILYSTREERGAGFKAGNLRHGIEETAKKNAGEFMASLDADMVADGEWLRRMLPHMLLDPKMAMVNQPQHYYNTAKNDPLSDQVEFDLWFTLFEPLNDRVGQAMCQGSGFIVRRSAIDDIGGWPLAQTGEDVMCSLKLLFNGWNLAFVREYLQHGTTADTLGARLKQKGRWAVDHVGFIGAFGLRLTTTSLGALTWRELTSFTTTLGLFLLPLTLLLAPLDPNGIVMGSGEYSLLLGMLLLVVIAAKVNDYIVYRALGLTRLSKYQALNSWSALCKSNSLPYMTPGEMSWKTPEHLLTTYIAGAASSFVSSLLPGSSGPSFFVTGTFKSPTNERSKQGRAGLAQRLFFSEARSFFFYVICSSALLLWCLQESSTRVLPTISGAVRVVLLPGPAVKAASCIWKISVPVWYMISPPDVPDWRSLLERNGKGVLRPKRSIDRYMSPAGSEKDSSLARVWYDTLELSVLLFFLGQRW